MKRHVFPLIPGNRPPGGTESSHEACFRLLLTPVSYPVGSKYSSDVRSTFVSDEFFDPTAARRVMEGMIKYLEEVLKLPVNREKSEVAKFKDITFLGFRIVGWKIRISEKSLAKFKQKVKLLTRRNNPLSMYKIITELNQYERLDRILPKTTNESHLS